MPLQPDPIPPLPNFAEPNIIPSSGQIQALSPADFLTANPRVPGTLALTVGGTITNNDPVTANFAAPFLPNGLLSVPVVALTGDTTATLATKLAKAINDNATLQNLGVYADDVGSVVTVSWPGLLGASVTVSVTVGGSATETVGLNPANGIPAGGSGPVIPYQTFPYAFNGSIIEFRVGSPKIVSAQLAAALARDNQPVT